MKVQLLDAKSVGSTLKNLITKYEEFYWSVAWMTETFLLDDLIANKKRIKKFVVGIDFVQTSPDALERVSKIKAVRVATGNKGRTFHPKVYLFKSGEQCAAIVGSSNFTQGGVRSNDEASLFLLGNSDEAAFMELESAVADWWASGSTITPAFLETYRLRWKATRRSREALTQSLKMIIPSAQAPHPKLQSTSFADYLREIKGSTNHNISGRLEILRRANKIFSENESFSTMTELERKAIAGSIGPNQIEKGESIKGLDWFWFGSTRAVGGFSTVIINNPNLVGLALDCIPDSGAISKADYAGYVEHFKTAFAKSPRKIDVPFSSRLLAMKRPDYFVCVNTRNVSGLSGDLGFKKKDLSIDTYWDLIILPVLDSEWWNEKRPRGLDGQIWDARVAMLDAIYYDWSITP